MNRLGSWFAVAFLVLGAGPPVYAQAAGAKSGALAAAVEEFISAFTTLDEARFDAMWADDATLFMPFYVQGHGGGRFSGRAEVLKAFHDFFASARKDRKGPNYLNIHPEDVQIQDYGDVAIVSFHLRKATGRRTAVMRNIGGVWRIAHLHASPMEAPAAKP
jgi:ketosteroid isomerase-like protein